MAISHDGKRLGYVIQKREGFLVFLDGKPRGLYRSIQSTVANGREMPVLQFSPDGAQFGFIATRGDGTHVVVVDNAESTPCPNLSELRFGAVGKHWVCIGAKLTDPPCFVVEDGAVRQVGDAIISSCFGPDGQTLINEYSCGIEIGGHLTNDLRLTSDVVFSRDSRHYAFAANHLSSDNQAIGVTVIKDGLEVASYPRTTFINEVALSAQGNHCAYSLEQPSGSQEYSEHTGIRGSPGLEQTIVTHIVRDGRAELAVEKAEGLIFNSKGNKFGYIVRRSGKWQFVINGTVVGQPYDEILSPVAFSPSGDHFAYAAKSNGNWKIILDDHEISDWQVVVSQAFGVVRNIASSYPIVFDNDSTLSFIAKKSDQVFRVSYPLILN